VYLPQDFVGDTIQELQDTVKSKLELLEVLENVTSIPVTPSIIVLQQDNFTLNDKTLHWSKDVHRLWLDKTLTTSSSKPPAQLILTNLGWNHPDPDVGIRFTRSVRMHYMAEAVTNHPWFHPTTWDDVEKDGNFTIDSDIRYYAFLDVETCFELNWPNYSGSEASNRDLEFNRTFLAKRKNRCSKLSRCRAIKNALKHRIFHTAGVKATLVLFECSGDGQSPLFRRKHTKDEPIALVTLSSTNRQLQNPPDQGLAPPAPKPVQLSAKLVEDIATCRTDSTENSTRPLLLTFAGNFRHKTRKKLSMLNNEKDVLILHRYKLKNFFNGSFEEFLTHSKFAATPRGDNKFSYRFTEVLSAGTIPVVHADGWILPFRKELVDWSECAVVIPEGEVSETLNILAKIDDEQRCKMRQKCYEVYQKYMKDSEGVLSGIVEGLEILEQQSKTQ